jgi:hypothetical protein
LDGGSQTCGSLLRLFPSPPARAGSWASLGGTIFSIGLPRSSFNPSRSCVRRPGSPSTAHGGRGADLCDSQTAVRRWGSLAEGSAGAAPRMVGSPAGVVRTAVAGGPLPWAASESKAYPVLRRKTNPSRCFFDPQPNRLSASASAASLSLHRLYLHCRVLRSASRPLRVAWPACAVLSLLLLLCCGGGGGGGQEVRLKRSRRLLAISVFPTGR